MTKLPVKPPVVKRSTVALIIGLAAPTFLYCGVLILSNQAAMRESEAHGTAFLMTVCLVSGELLGWILSELGEL